MPDIVWNRDAALTRLMHNETLLNKVCALFIRTSPAQVEGIQTAVADNDFPTAQATAHTLKGASGNIGGECLMSLCAQIEQAAKAQDATQLQQLSAELSDTYQALLTALPQ
ncbi:MAG: Hpt domain-containing protein [Pseudomonadota bacterium]|nr:Hpt domain-containing protein [Pseudomonadota bacterium]